jgi:hypothetical protein
MIKWFINRRRDIKFANAFEMVAQEQFDNGVISFKKLEKCKKAANNRRVMSDARAQFTGSSDMLGGIFDWDWDAILEWFREWIIPAMRVIIPIIMLLDEE